MKRILRKISHRQNQPELTKRTSESLEAPPVEVPQKQVKTKDFIIFRICPNKNYIDTFTIEEDLAATQEDQNSIPKSIIEQLVCADPPANQITLDDVCGFTDQKLVLKDFPKPYRVPQSDIDSMFTRETILTKSKIKGNGESDKYLAEMDFFLKEKIIFPFQSTSSHNFLGIFFHIPSCNITKKNITDLIKKILKRALPTYQLLFAITEQQTAISYPRDKPLKDKTLPLEGYATVIFKKLMSVGNLKTLHDNICKMWKNSVEECPGQLISQDISIQIIKKPSRAIKCMLFGGNSKKLMDPNPHLVYNNLLLHESDVKFLNDFCNLLRHKEIFPYCYYDEFFKMSPSDLDTGVSSSRIEENVKLTHGYSVGIFKENEDYVFRLKKCEIFDKLLLSNKMVIQIDSSSFFRNLLQTIPVEISNIVKDHPILRISQKIGQGIFSSYSMLGLWKDAALKYFTNDPIGSQIEQWFYNNVYSKTNQNTAKLTKNQILVLMVDSSTSWQSNIDFIKILGFNTNVEEAFEKNSLLPPDYLPENGHFLFYDSSSERAMLVNSFNRPCGYISTEIAAECKMPAIICIDTEETNKQDKYLFDEDSLIINCCSNGDLATKKKDSQDFKILNEESIIDRVLGENFCNTKNVLKKNLLHLPAVKREIVQTMQNLGHKIMQYSLLRLAVNKSLKNSPEIMLTIPEIVDILGILDDQQPKKMENQQDMINQKTSIIEKPNQEDIGKNKKITIVQFQK